MKKTVAIYARSSRNEEVSGQSIYAQVSECTAVAKQKYGEDINIELYKDEGVGGQAGYKPALQSLQYDVAAKPFAAVIVSSLDRVNRSTVRAMETIYRLRQKHADFIVARDERCFMWDDARANWEFCFLECEAQLRSKRMKASWARRKAAQQTSMNN